MKYSDLNGLMPLFLNHSQHAFSLCLVSKEIMDFGDIADIDPFINEDSKILLY